MTKESRILNRRRGILTLLILLSLFIPALAAVSRSPVARAQSRHLYIVFLPGLCGPTRDPDCQGAANAAKRARDTFSLLQRALQAAKVHYTPVYYSYDPSHTGSYTVKDTRQSLGRSVLALEYQVHALLARDPGAEVDLVGYSLGGVVAASWTVTNARVAGTGPYRGVRPFVHSLVTMDSPLKGIQGDYLGPILAHLYGGGIWYDLRPHSAAIRHIVSQGSRWWRRRAHLHTVANRADILVPPNEALLGAQHTVTDRNCSLDLSFLRTCHGAVLIDASLARFVACHWITNGRQCVKPVPTPTLTPSPSPSPTLTPTATATPTASATATLTPTATPTPMTTTTVPQPTPTQFPQRTPLPPPTSGP